MMMLRSLLLAVAVGLLALAFSSSPAPAFADLEADLAVSHQVSPPSQVDVNTGFGVPVSISFSHLGPSEETVPAVFSYSLTGAPDCTPHSQGPSQSSISFGSVPGLFFTAPAFCTTAGLKTFVSRVEFLPGPGVTDPDLANNVSEVTFFVLIGAINVSIDIKPGSDPNCVNAGGNGVIPVAILTTPTFNAAEVDPLTVTLLGGAIRLNGKSGNAGSLQDVDSDGDLDRVIQVIDFNLSTGETTAILSGVTFGGTPIEGADAVCVVP